MSEQRGRKSEELIRAVLGKAAEHDERAQRLLENCDFANAGKRDVEAISRILLDEFTATGIDSNSEPTQRGLDIEAAIDWIRRPIAGRQK